MKLKVCGLSKSIDVETCVDNNIDYCGFILNYPKSHRYITLDRAKKLTDINKKNSKYVGVLVNPDENELEKFSQLNLDYFQLYGNYTENSLSRIKERYKKNIITALQVKKKQDVEKYKYVLETSDVILWDSSGYEDSLSWDYNWIKHISIKIEKMIAGNITVNKLKNLSKLADTVDVSGALETNKVKDINKIKNFISQLKKIND